MEHAAERVDIAAFVTEAARQHQLGCHERGPPAQSGDPLGGIDRRLRRHGVRVARQRNLQTPDPPCALTISTARRLAAQGVER